MSERRSRSDNESQEDLGEGEPSSQVFELIDIANDDRETNLRKARSYITKTVRRRKLKEQKKQKKRLVWLPPLVQHIQS